MRVVKAGIKGRALETSTERVQRSGVRRQVVSRGSLEVSASAKDSKGYSTTALSRRATRITATPRAIAESLPGYVQPLEPTTPGLGVFVRLLVAAFRDAKPLYVGKGDVAVHGLALRSGLERIEGRRGWRREGTCAAVRATLR